MKVKNHNIAAETAGRHATPARKRVLIAAHSHPQISKGGAEISAYQLYLSMKAGTQYDPWFLGCVRDQISAKLGATFNQPFGEREYLYAAGAFDWFNFANQDPNFPGEFTRLLEQIEPDIVHFHHYLNFGVEAFLHLRRARPQAKIIVTLHEYLAICHHYGQMITKTNKTLCYQATHLKCSKCFYDKAPSDFFLREKYIKRFFDLADHFIAPSRFLAQRYVAWGVPEDRISVIENVIPAPLATPKAFVRAPGDPLRIGFFGQVSMLKGINVMFDAAAMLEEEECNDVVFEIFGDHSGQPQEFQKDFLERLAKAGRNVKFHGPYDSNRVDTLMQSVDAILVPSIWWENSPVVIQEALRNRRPIFCSDIGGMAEKVRDGQDGFHFPAGNSVALASLVKRFNGTREALAGLVAGIQTPPSADAVIAQHIDLYNSIS